MQGIGLMLASKLGEGCNESRVIMGGQDQVESPRHATHRKAKSRGMVPDTSGNNRFGFSAGPSGFAQASHGSGEHGGEQ